RGEKAEGNDWEIRQDFHVQDIKAANVLAAEAVKRGVKGVGLCAKGVETAEQMAQLLHGIDPMTTAIHFMCSKSFGKTLDLFVAYLKDNKIDPAKVKGSVAFDPIAFALKHGEFYESYAKNIEEAKALFARFTKELPLFRLVSVKAGMLHNSGATITQELGMGLAWANEYLGALTDAGLSVDEVAPRLTFSFCTGSNYFMEIAKLRAARMLWAQIVAQYKPAKEESAAAFIHSSASAWNKSIYDPYVNLLRSTTETMSAAIGGANSIHVSNFDEAYRKPDEFGSRIARNQQIILKEESFMDKIVDPAAGSYYIENLTDSIARYAWEQFLAIEEKGGFAKAVEAGYIQDEVARSAAQRDADLASRKLVLTGVNQYPNLNENMAKEIEETHCGCGCGCKAGAFKTLKPYRGAAAFEALRLQTEKSGRRPKVFLLTYGNLAMRKARAGFATNFFGCAGYEIIDNAGFKTGAEGAKAALAAKADITVLCSSDDEYAELVAAAVPELKGKTHIVLAGYPKEQLDAFKAQGVEEFIHVRSNVLDVLTAFQQKLMK
ncbi:MAG: acyl-CoA mutase large subunit family protein, partial [Bacteroidales bacterium]|nr:acyl-CoA mutase large subunit family protein [Bacteroidales bacterium]